MGTTVNHEDGAPWDCDVKANRAKARALLEGQKLALLIGSVVRTGSNQIQAINVSCRNPQVVSKERVRAMVHSMSVCQLYQMQVDAGRHSLHEHAAGATSWKQQCVETRWRQFAVEQIVNDQCQFGQQYEGQPVMKPTGWMSNSFHILRQLGRRCSGPRGESDRRRRWRAIGRGSASAAHPRGC